MGFFGLQKKVSRWADFRLSRKVGGGRG